jgi:cytoskeletal protein CcmA (bactofilin family)
VSQPAILGKSVTIKGNILGREDLTINGEVEGTIDVTGHCLTIGPEGNVRAGVKARELVVAGKLNGQAHTTEKIEIRKEAQLIGDIQTARIVIEDGAYFKGAVDITKGEPKSDAVVAGKK